MRKVTTPFPNERFFLDCGHLPEVRQWLHDNDVSFINGKSVLTYRLDEQFFSCYKTQEKWYVLIGREEYYKRIYDENGFLPLTFSDDPQLTAEEAFVLLLKKHRLFSNFKQIYLIDPTVLVTISNLTYFYIDTSYLSYTNYYKYRSVLWKWEKLKDKFNFPNPDFSKVVKMR